MIDESTQLLGNNTSLLQTQSRNLTKLMNLAKTNGCFVYLVVIFVFIAFIFTFVFMRMFSPR